MIKEGGESPVAATKAAKLGPAKGLHEQYSMPHKKEMPNKSNLNDHTLNKQHSDFFDKNDRDSPINDLRISFAMLQDKGAHA